VTRQPIQASNEYAGFSMLWKQIYAEVLWQIWKTLL